mmetsp:Transcript_116015/g.247998  ORF Transcript_116015/g.247998 Transcript_116015/m.247998 type:complete len:229 (+) Transcript_116015:970-1656(+)
MVLQELVDVLVLALLDLVDLHLPPELEVYLQLLHLLLILILELFVVVLEGLAELVEALGEALAHHLHIVLVFELLLLEVALDVELLLVHGHPPFGVHLPLLLDRHLTSILHLAPGLLVLVLQVLHLLLMDLDVHAVVPLKHLHLTVHIQQLCLNLLHLLLRDFVEPVHHVLLELHVISILGSLVEAVLEGILPLTEGMDGEVLQVRWDLLLDLCLLLLFLLTLLPHGR